jgi:hypothetical protein
MMVLLRMVHVILRERRPSLHLSLPEHNLSLRKRHLPLRAQESNPTQGDCFAALAMPGNEGAA